jgi:hypothetical protein
VAQGSVKDVENYLSPSEAGEILGTSGQWVKQLARRGELEAVETHLGWLIEPGSVERLADRRVLKAEGRVASLKSARSRTKKKMATTSVRGRALHGKSLRTKSKRSRRK